MKIPTRNQIEGRVTLDAAIFQQVAADARAKAPESMKERIEAAIAMIEAANLAVLLDPETGALVVNSRSERHRRYYASTAICQCEFYAQRRKDRRCAHMIAATLVERTMKAMKPGSPTNPHYPAAPLGAVVVAQLRGNNLYLVGKNGESVNIPISIQQAATVAALLKEGGQ